MSNAPEIIGEGVLGRKVEGSPGSIDVFELPQDTQEVSYTSDEVASFCPHTGQPDFYVVEITIHGSRFGLESKSLKLYLQSFNDKEKGQFCEQFADTIAGDVHEATKETGAVSVILTQKPRGGISIKAQAWKG